MNAEQTPEVTAERIGRIGYLTLSKPKTLNALTLSMIRLLEQGLLHHEQDAAVEAIVIRSNNERAFCAGGDMKHIRKLSINGAYEEIESFFTEEYALNLHIANCKKPYIALLDGVTMGGGIGLSVHGSHRIVTERALLAMPETRIGLFPDVGGSYFLPRLPNRAGWWLAMTAAPVRGVEAVLAGLATHYLSSNSLSAMVEELENHPKLSVTSIFDLHATTVDAHEPNPAETDSCLFSETLAQRAKWFESDDVASIRQSLTNTIDADHNSRKDAQHLRDLLDSASPWSLSMIQSLFTKAAGQTLETCLTNERAAAITAAKHPDFIEGVRAVLVDKDRNPSWS